MIRPVRPSGRHTLPPSNRGRPRHASLFERAIDEVPFLEKELFLLRRLVRPGDVCLDIGAAGGAHLLVMAVRAGARGRVIGVEPRPGSLRALRWLVRAVGLAQRVELVAAAFSDRAGRQNLRIPVVPTRAHLPGTSADHRRRAAFNSLPARHVEVETMTLDAFVEQAGLARIDVIKCDVEGAELAVLAGATRTFARFRPVLVVEADDAHQSRYDARAQDVFDAVVALGYVGFRYVRGRLDAVRGVVEGEDDYVFVPRERLSDPTSRARASSTSPTSSRSTTSARSS